MKDTSVGGKDTTLITVLQVYFKGDINLRKFFEKYPDESLVLKVSRKNVLK